MRSDSECLDSNAANGSMDSKHGEFANHLSMCRLELWNLFGDGPSFRRYQWQLFIVVGFDWAMDNMWPISTSLIFTAVTNEFSPSRPPLLTLSQNIGLLAGAMFWGCKSLSSDRQRLY